MIAADLRYASEDAILSDFLAFVDSKPADETYRFCSSGGCAFAQYLRSTGAGFVDVRMESFSFWTDKAFFNTSRDLPKILQSGRILLPFGGVFGLTVSALMYTIGHDRHTWGGLSKRLHKAIDPKPVPAKLPSISDFVHGLVARLRPAPALFPVPIRS
jgi:hypothetical protein